MLLPRSGVVREAPAPVQGSVESLLPGDRCRACLDSFVSASGMFGLATAAARRLRGDAERLLDQPADGSGARPTARAARGCFHGRRVCRPASGGSTFAAADDTFGPDLSDHILRQP